MKSNRSLQGRLRRNRLALPPQRPPPQDPFQTPTSPDLSLVLEDNVEVIGPFVPPGPAASHKKDDIHAFYRSIETNEIPKEHVEKYYIPLLTQIFIPTDEITREVFEWIGERVDHARERGVKGVDTTPTYNRIMNNVAETHKERIEKFEIPEEHVEEYYIPLLIQTPILDKIAREVTTWIKERIIDAEEMGLKEIDFKQTHIMIVAKVAKTHKERIEKRREEIEEAKAKAEAKTDAWFTEWGVRAKANEVKAEAEKKKKRAQPTRPRKSWSKMRQEANRLRVDRFKKKVNKAYSKMKQGDVGDSTWSEKLNELRYDNKEFQDIMEKKAYEMEIPRRNRDESRQVNTGSFPRKYLYGNIQDETQMGRTAYNHLLATLDEYNES